MSLAFVHQSSLSLSPRRQIQLPHNRELILPTSRHAAAKTRQKNGTGTKVNLRQIPDFLLHNEKYEEDIIIVDSRRSNLQDNESSSGERLSLPVKQENPVTTFSTLASVPPIAAGRIWLRNLADANILDNLIQNIDSTTPHVGIVRLNRLSRLAQRSTLFAVAEKDYVNTATSLLIECIVAQIDRAIHGDSSRAVGQIERQLIYCDALRDMRVTLMKRSEVDWGLFKTMLLFDLFELLDLKSGPVNDYHAEAASKTLASFEPSSVNNEVRRDLLAAQAELLILNAVVTNTECFLQKSGWQSALKSSMIYEGEFGPRTPLVLSLTMISANVPGLFRKVTSLISRDCVEEHISLAKEICELIHRYENWLLGWDALGHGTQRLKINSSSKDAMFEAVVSTRCLGYFAMCNRLLAAIMPLPSVEVERRAMHASNIILESTNSCSSSGAHVPGIRLARQVALSVVSTTSSWSHHSSYGLYTIQDPVFEIWCKLLDRSNHS